MEQERGVLPGWLAPAALIAAVLSVGLVLLRVLIQGGRTEGPHAIYTNTERQFYVTDPVLGWKEAEGTWFWLGLELTAVTLAAAVGVGIALWLRRRWRDAEAGGWKKRLVPVMGVGAAVVSLSLLVLPVWAWSSGFPPEGSLLAIPDGLESLKGARAGSFSTGQAGRYRVVPEHSRVVAKVSAGEETFDVVFPEPEGFVEMDPTRLKTAQSARFSVPTAGLNAGPSMRTKSVREDYLLTDEFPEISLELLSISDSKIDEEDTKAEISVRVRLNLMGSPREHDVTAILTAVREDAARAELDLGDGPGYVLRAQLSWAVKGSVLEPKIEAFDDPTIPIIVRLVLAFDASQGT